MCSTEEHQEELKLLKEIRDRFYRLSSEPLDSTLQISTNQPLIIDFKGRKHLFLWSANALTLLLDDLGQIAVTANAWVNISFQQGMRLTPQSQSTLVPVFIRATDETIP